jgi:hypothetical protein
MTLILTKNNCFTRFVPCVDGAGLIKILSQVARRAMDGEGLSDFSAGKRFTDDFKPAVKEKYNLTAVEFFEGKFYGAKLKPINNRLENRTPSAPSNS